MVALVLEFAIAFAIAAWVWGNLHPILGVIAFFAVMSYSNTLTMPEK